MNVRSHRFATVTIWVAGLVVVCVWGRSMGVETGQVKADRDRFQGTWVASLVQSGPMCKLEGASAEGCRVEFDGKNVVFHDLVDQPEARGTFYLEQRPVKGSIKNWVDFKLDAGWLIGVYEFDGETLKLALNGFAPPERLGVPTRPRPRQALPGDGHNFYVFRRPKS